VAFYPHIAVVVVVPVACYPFGVGVWGGLIGAGNPYVAVAVPAVVAVVPGPLGMLVGRGRDGFANRGRRTNANYNLGLRDACGEDEPTDAGE